MVPDEFQQAWRTQSSQTRVTVDAALLLNAVRRSEREFQNTIYLRDVREVGVAVVMVPVWFVMGYALSLPWTWYLGVPAFLWVAGFIVVDRRRHRLPPSEPDEPLLENVKRSLTQIEHQIWLLRNVFWWYLLPFILPMLVFFADVARRSSKNWWEAAAAFGLPASFVAALYFLIYCLNQYAVRAQLEPRRQELLALIAGLGDESAVEQIAAGGATQVAKARWLKQLLIIACMGLVVIGPIAFVVWVSRDRTEGIGYPRLSPFAAVRWQQEQPEVEVGGQWYQLVSLDDLPVADILAFSRRNYGERWQKRFEEDLVELLTRMGHPPRSTVKLEVRSLRSSETSILENVPMTTANRQAIKSVSDAWSD